MEKILFGWRGEDEKINVPEILGNFSVNFCNSKHEVQMGDNIYYFLSLKYPCNERKPMVGFVQVSAIGWKRKENRKKLGILYVNFLSHVIDLCFELELNTIKWGLDVFSIKGMLWTYGWLIWVLIMMRKSICCAYNLMGMMNLIS